MSRFLTDYLRRYRQKKLVRPWALSAPVLVLLIALPLLRPLRQPDPDLRRISDEEKARLATVQAIVEHRTLAIDQTDFTTTSRKVELPDGRGHDRWYSEQAPAMSVMLSPAYWVMRQRGLSFKSNPAAVLYFLTLVGVTIPAACCAGLVYRMGRLFELRRPWRALLAAASVLATGLISYATVLNPHVPAATFLLASAACLLHLSIAKKRVWTWLWLALSGLCAATGAAIDPSAVPFLVLFPAAVIAFRWPVARRVGGVLVYALGALGPILAHAALTVPVTHDFWQGAGLRASAERAGAFARLPRELRDVRDARDARDGDDDDEPAAATPLQSAGQALGRLCGALFGEHGLLSHFPILLMGVVGGVMIMHRHWPSSAKVLASATVAGAVFLIVAYSVHLKDWRQWRDAMFAARWFVLFGPLLLFWAGAWLRKPHKPLAWAAAGLVLAFSVTVSLIGATGPLPRDGFDHYTAADALGTLLHPNARIDTTTTVAAD